MRFKRKKASSLLESYESEMGLYKSEQKIKSEPKDKTPPYVPQYGDQWAAMTENMQTNVNVAQGSHNPFATEMWGGPSYVSHPSVSPTNQPVSPPMHMQTLQVLTPNVQGMGSSIPPISPNIQVMSSHAQTMSPHGHAMSPHGHAMSPHGHSMSPHGPSMSPHSQTVSPYPQTVSPYPQTISPHGQVLSPYPQTMSPGIQVMSPQHMERISPGIQHPQQNMEHMSPNLVQQPSYVQMQQNLMDSDNNSTPSLSTLLDRGEGIILNSGELSGLSSLLGD